mmetsp:Transcript_6751/g.9853  ORF Transcript_6751/g.9853 Transcript_6751/m.9853 type:complete len:195 (+) Transcript_6751:125-709(+)|eukprot:CAMPEP_0194243642 /NCGR_PEP_ID=MMETSP0158-20130606/9567_1 /TAXON_ID=33649 /ORGANISM="Thalassionema nitzschioides, Strain L26-B" /LENGTH=194 /DNA_ID=CAMNT_0038978933 /DNA_START=81 /DNA_END=665 /DNA_ORIENTATION=+
MKTSNALFALCVSTIATVGNYGVSATIASDAFDRPSITDFQQLMKGIMEGAFQDEFKAAESCFEDGLSIIKTIEIAVEDIKEGTKESVEEGVKLIGEVVQEVSKKEIVECKEAAEEFHELSDMAKLLSHPASFLYHAGHNIIINHVEIEQEVSAAIEAWDEDPRDYYAVGFNIGETLEQVFIGYKQWLMSVAEK